MKKGYKVYPERHTCSKCGKDKLRAYFRKIRGLVYDISPTCKSCEKKELNLSHLRFNNELSKTEYSMVYKLLKTIGYDPKKDIHQQFCDKHNLEYKEKSYDSCVYYSFDELDEHMFI